jgi:hypothetical protein
MKFGRPEVRRLFGPTIKIADRTLATMELVVSPVWR